MINWDVFGGVRTDLRSRGYSVIENRNCGSAQAIQIGTKAGKRVLFGANDDRDSTTLSTVSCGTL